MMLYIDDDIFFKVRLHFDDSPSAKAHMVNAIEEDIKKNGWDK